MKIGKVPHRAGHGKTGDGGCIAALLSVYP
jgi:hypothetical protein